MGVARKEIREKFRLLSFSYVCTFDKSFFNLYNKSTKFKGGLFMSNRNSISYRTVGDYLIPNLVFSPEEASVTLSKWGMMHKNYLEKHKKALFSSLLTQGKLYQHCAEVENQATEMFDILVEQMKIAEGVTEQLKEENQLEWVCCMGNIEQKAREIDCTETIYS